MSRWRLASMGNVHPPTYKWYMLGLNNPLILTFDPNFCGISQHPGTNNYNAAPSKQGGWGDITLQAEMEDLCAYKDS